VITGGLRLEGRPGGSVAVDVPKAGAACWKYQIECFVDLLSLRILAQLFTVAALSSLN
jgi:hypothetical protein